MYIGKIWSEQDFVVNCVAEFHCFWYLYLRVGHRIYIIQIMLLFRWHTCWWHIIFCVEGMILITHFCTLDQLWRISTCFIFDGLDPVQWTCVNRLSLVQIMACRLFGTKPLSELTLMLFYYWLGPSKESWVKYQSNYNISHKKMHLK